MSNPVDFQWQDPNRVVSRVVEMLRQREKAIRSVPERAVRRGTFELLKFVQAEVPKVTSTLVRSITAVVEKVSSDLIEGRVGTWLEYARYVEEGTGVYGPQHKAFVVTAKTKRGLFWGAYNDKGKAVVVKRVTIQGMKPRAPFARAMAKFLPRYVEIIEQELARTAA